MKKIKISFSPSQFFEKGTINIKDENGKTMFNAEIEKRIVRLKDIGDTYILDMRTISINKEIVEIIPSTPF